MSAVGEAKGAVPELTRSGVRSQSTIGRPVEFRGLSLFHGYDATVRILPAAENTGIVFRRVDLSGAPDIPARCEFVTRVPRRTVLAASNEATVETVEHLMAALAGLQVDNCLIEINAPEVPAYDGSCRPFCDGILDAGLVQTTAAASVVTVSSACRLKGQARQSLALRPYLLPCPAITYHFDYGVRGLIPAQQFSIELSPETFYQQISNARTFVLESEIAALKKMGYGSHLTTRDIVVIGSDGPIDNSLRWSDEGVRHKILDCVGDLALSGTAFHGHLTATRSGHHLNHEMANVLTMMKQGQPAAAITAA
ncbi:MAG: UDP-3-O-acyl-N-acetylglucosamine deacetylase [Fuerstiella sp.]